MKDIGIKTEILRVNLRKKARMPAYFKIDKERRLVMSVAADVFTIDDALAHQEKLLKDPDFDPSFSQLWDLTQITKWEITSADYEASGAEDSILIPFSPGLRSD
jgi:hypothetical protein